MNLSTNQLKYIQNFLKKNEITHDDLSEELLDHIATQIEIKIATGIPFHTAAASSFESFKKDEMKEIQSQILSLNQKQFIMKRLSLAALALLMFSTLVWSIDFDPPSRSPLGEKFTISSPFGERMHPIHKKRKMHKGIDFRAPIGAPVYATADGIISKTQFKSTGYGNLIIIKHDDNFETYYAQLSEIQVTVDQKVKKGDLIGLVGSSGTSTAPHLHYEVRKDGKAQDPEMYLRP